MSRNGRSMISAALVGATAALVIVTQSTAWSQPPGARPGMGPGAPGAGAPAPRPFGAPPRIELPAEPTAVALPNAKAVDGPGPMFDSSPAQWPGHDMEHYDYVANEYFVSGTADGDPYTTRVVIRQPADDSRFSGLVVAEAMHPVGGAHAFEYNSVYIMDSGHIAVEIATAGVEQFARFNADRYADIEVGNTQANDILAQVGALMRSEDGPLADLELRRMVLWGTSASSAILTNYLPAHAVYRTPAMQHIYDGFMPTSNGSTISPVDVPMIQVPTQHEYESIATAQQDGDEPGSQFRVYEFVGIGHLDSRNNLRLQPEHCVHPLSNYPVEAYMSVALHHLLRWVDEGIAPPMAERVLLDRYTVDDGSLMALDNHGNPVGGIRTPYVDVPVAKYTARNVPVQEESQGPSGRGGGMPMGPGLLCILSAYQTPFSPAELRELYGSKENYVREFEQRLDELEQAGWSLPVYHDLILADARKVQF